MELDEPRCAQRRHRLGRHTRNPASTSHGRLRSGVDLSGRVSRGHIVVFDFCASNSALLTKLKTKPKTRVKSSFPGTFTKFYEYATFPAPKRHIIFARQPITHFAPRRVVRPNSISRAIRHAQAMSTSNTTPELAPPSVQVITPLPYDPWKLGGLYNWEAVVNAETALPIYVRHAAGCKVCFCGNFPCPICIYVLPCDDDTRCFMPIPCCFGVPIPNFFVCSGAGCQDDSRGRGDSWIFRGEGEFQCECIVVDKESGMINVYRDQYAAVNPTCTCVPITKLHELRR